MCGIAGICCLGGLSDVDRAAIAPMTAMLTHRGPDEDGFFIDQHVALGHRRLSIIDLSGGRQPIYNEDRSIAVIFNGEIFNYIELMDQLTKKGHRFATRSDTEAIVHAYEEWGSACFERFNGQWAIALWDMRERRLILSRDRLGVRPLFHAMLPNGTLLFASEMKSILRHPQMRAELDIAGIEQVFTVWANIPPRTVFSGISELAPGSFATVDHNGFAERRYWTHAFPGRHEYEDRPLSYYTEGLREILHDAVSIRLRADVTVAAYLSGGIDSSVISALVKRFHNKDLVTFSVAFKDPQFDERAYQQLMVKHLGTDHRMVEADYSTIGNAFGQTVWFAEKPMIRTAPAPLFLLSRLVRENGIKVVLTGEGADEMLAGYDIFKEAAIRRFWSRQPDSTARSALLSRIYPDIPRNASAGAFWRQFFRTDLEKTDDPWYSHRIRWRNTASVKRLLHPDIRAQLSEDRHVWEPLTGYLQPHTDAWHPLCRAQYLEMAVFLSGYLLSTQGDRMLMGNGVEGRFPFLDHRVVDFAATIPPRYKLNGLNEKFVLKKAFDDVVPSQILNRPKQPYRAPIGRCFMQSASPDNAEMLSPDAVMSARLLDPVAVSGLTRKLDSGNGALSERENMAVVGAASLQWLHRHFLLSDGLRSAPQGKA